MKKIQTLTKLLISLSKGKDDREKEKLVKGFLAILKEKKKFHLAKKVLEELKREKKKKELNLILARKFDERTIAEIKKKLRKIFGDEKEIKIKTNEDIIAGFLAENGNYLIDATIKGLLNKVRLID